MMVNGSSSSPASDRRTRQRGGVQAEAQAHALGIANLNPFGDLHTLQHLSVRLARSMRGSFEPLLRRLVRSWAEPVVVQRFADYCAERQPGLTAWVPLTMAPSSGQALIVIEGRFALELLDLFFGGSGDTPHTMPTEFSPAAETLIRRLADTLSDQMRIAWEPVARIDFTPRSVEASTAMLSAIDADDAMIVTRFGLASTDAQPTFVDIVYPVAALKQHGPSINTKVHGRTAEPDPRWRSGLTRAVMNVKFPVRSVLAEPVIPLGRLLDLKEGDIIPISFGAEVPVMVAARRLGTGTVGTANGQAAIRLSTIDYLEEEDFQ